MLSTEVYQVLLFAAIVSNLKLLADNNGPVYDQVPTKNKHSAQRVYNFIRSQWLYGVCVILMIALIAVSTLLALELTDDFFNSRTTTYPTTTNTTTNATTTATAPVG